MSEEFILIDILIVLKACWYNKFFKKLWLYWVNLLFYLYLQILVFIFIELISILFWNRVTAHLSVDILSNSIIEIKSHLTGGGWIWPLTLSQKTHKCHSPQATFFRKAAQNQLQCPSSLWWKECENPWSNDSGQRGHFDAWKI